MCVECWALLNDHRRCVPFIENSKSKIQNIKFQTLLNRFIKVDHGLLGQDEKSLIVSVEVGDEDEYR